MRTVAVLLVLIAVCAPARADGPPPRSVQVFFDDNMQTNLTWADNYVGRQFKVLAYDLPGGLSEYRFHLEISDTMAVFNVGFPAGVVNSGTGSDFLLQATGPCPTPNGMVVLAEGIYVPLSSVQDVTLCLGPVSDPGPTGSGLDYRACGSTTWEDLSLLYAGCAVINPWNTWPEPIPNNDPNAIIFSAAAVQGEPTDLVSLPLKLSKALLKSGDPTLVGRIVLDLTWDPAVAAFDTVASSVPSGWTTASTAAPGSLNLTLTGPTGLNPTFSDTELATVDFRLADVAGATSVQIEVTELLDLTGLPITAVAPAPADMTVTCLKGDVVPNRDINALDVLLTLEFAAQLRQPDAKEFCRAEVNDNGMIDAGDATLILAQAVGAGKQAAGPAPSPWIESAPGTLRIGVDAAAGVDLLIRWDPEQGGLAGWTADPSLQCVARSEPGELQLAMARTETTPAAIVLEFTEPGLAATLATAWFWDRTGSLAADRSGQSVRLDQPELRLAQLLAPVPNPFNPVTEIRFTMPDAGWARLRVLDARGRQVWHTRIAETRPGANTLKWRGVDDSDRRLASGSYLIVLETESGRATKRVTLLK